MAHVHNLVHPQYAPPLIVDGAQPSKQIHGPPDLDKFLRSESALQYLSWLQSVNDAIQGKKVSDTDIHESELVTKILAVLKKLSEWVDDIPPLEQPMRFGNKAFRIWLEKVEESSKELMLEILPESLHAAAAELAVYFKNSFGNKTRIDYGTGHETFFAVWIHCLEKIGALTKEDQVAEALRVFDTYLKLMRKIQRTYMLEPAGSHGVWSLDDYQFLPFFFGSGQLIGHKNITPKSVRNREIIEFYAKDYLYLSAIEFVLSVKSGPFGEHSPTLNSIAELPHWEKVNGGLMKMYTAEVLGKFPVVQHQLFGPIFPFPGQHFIKADGTEVIAPGVSLAPPHSVPSARPTSPSYVPTEPVPQ